MWCWCAFLVCARSWACRKTRRRHRHGAATAFVLTLASGASHLLNLLLLAAGLEYLRTIAFIVVIAAIVQFTEMVIHKTSPVLYQALGIYLPMITTNCAVLACRCSTPSKDSFVEALLFGLGSALGFSLVLVLFAELRERLEGADVPAPFRGAPIALVTAGLMSLAFAGLPG